jgi:hypothetical protein
MLEFLNNKHYYLTYFLVAAIHDQFVKNILVYCFSWGFSWEMRRDCGHLRHDRAEPSFSITQVGVTGQIKFLSTCTFHESAHNMAAGFYGMTKMREWKWNNENLMSLLDNQIKDFIESVASPPLFPHHLPSPTQKTCILFRTRSPPDSDIVPAEAISALLLDQ